MSSSLFNPTRFGNLELSNRMVMAPLTRCRAPQRIPNALMAEYYAQRATAGLILTEATSVTPMGVGYPDTPGIWSEEQIEGWRLTTSAVHRAGGKILVQLWHVGRISDPEFLDGQTPVSASAIRPQGEVSLLRPKRAYITPQPLSEQDIKEVIAQYRVAAQNAQRAGFDGVELHAANGYLIEQFLHSSTNHRTDDYGGTIANRARLLLAITDALIGVWGAGRVGVHVSPRGESHDMGDDNPTALFRYVAEELGRRQIAFLFARDRLGAGHFGDELAPIFRRAGGGAYIANEGLNFDSAQTLIDNGQADAVSFGMLYIANPDLVARFKARARLNEVNPKTLYGVHIANPREGYVDYPTLDA